MSTVIECEKRVDYVIKFSVTEAVAIQNGDHDVTLLCFGSEEIRVFADCFP
jgi:hypothetical protein